MTPKINGSLTNPVVESNDKIKSTFPLVTFAFILTLATGFVKERNKLTLNSYIFFKFSA